MLIAFDIDGTLIDFSSVEKAHHGSLMKAVEIIKGKGIKIENVPGVTDYMLIKAACKRVGIEIAVDDWKKIFETAGKLFRKEFRGRPKLIKGVKNFLTALKEQGHELILITGNLEEIAKHKLKLAGLWDFFSGGVFGDVIADERAELGKIAMAEYGRIDWVFGDTPHDIALARAIKAKAAVITTTYPEETLRKFAPEVIGRDYTDPRLLRAFDLEK